MMKMKREAGEARVDFFGFTETNIEGEEFQ